MEIKTEHAQKIAELTAELCVRRLADEQIKPLRDDVAELSNKVTRMETTVFDGGDGGLVHRIDSMKINCDEKHRAINSFINAPAKQVRQWKWMLAGMGLSGSLITAALLIHQYLK